MESGQSDSSKILVNRIRKALDPLVSLPVPITAAINGLAYGGGAELAVRCDLRVMDQQAVICFSEVKLGLMPDMGGGVALTKLVGVSKAADLILTARKVKAKEALNLGLVNRISLPGECLKEALNLAERIADNGPNAVKSALKIIRNTSDLSEFQALKIEAETAAKLIATGECMVGVAAFLEKKKPEFTD
jgi:enoyl-CoA hydratase/carnithine racemase